jgi:hypothetical protein
MRWQLKFLGLPILEICSEEDEYEDSELWSGGSGCDTERATEQYSPDDRYAPEEDFGFRSPR